MAANTAAGGAPCPAAEKLQVCHGRFPATSNVWNHPPVAHPHARQYSGALGQLQANFFDDMSLCPAWNAQPAGMVPWLPTAAAFNPAADTLYELALTASDMLKKIDFIPRMDVLYDEQNREMMLLADVPGYDKKSISVAEEDGALVIKGELSKDDETEQRMPHSRCLMKERRSGYFVRRFQLPKNADPNGITATMDKGLLRVIIKLQDTGPAKKAISIK